MSRNRTFAPEMNPNDDDEPPGGAPIQIQPDADVSRPEYMFLARESVRGLVPLRKMLYQTLKAFPNVPGVATAIEAGLEPYLRPAAWNATRIGRGETRGVVYCIDGTWFCLVEGSAAQEDLNNVMRWRSAENVFVETLIDQLIAIRPRKLVVAVFSRLVRAEEYSGKLLGAARRHVDEVYSGDLPTIVLSNEQSGTLWQMGTILSGWERKNLLRRMTIGMLINAADGRWVQGRSIIPFGYRLRPDGKVEPDISVKPAVGRMLELLATPGLTNNELVDRLAEAGVKSPHLIHRDPTSDGSVGLLRNPRGYLEGIRKWLPVYRTGQYLYRLRNPLPGEKQLGGFVAIDDGGTGRFEIVYDFGLPEGGWAASTLIEAAEANMAVAASRGGARSHRMVRPLVGLGYRSGGQLFKLIASEGSYMLICRDDDPGARFNGWSFREQPVGERLATMNSAELHTSIATTVMEAIRDGIEAEQLDGWSGLQAMGGARLVDVRANRLAVLDRQIGQAKARYDSLRRAAATAGQSEKAWGAELESDFLADAAAALTELRRLQADREAVETLPSRQLDLGAGFHAEAAFVARAMANLADAPRLVSREVARSITEVIPRLRFHVEGVRVRWTCSVAIAANGGVVRLSTSGEVPNRSFTYRSGTVKRRTRFNRGDVLLERVLWDGESLEEAARFHGVNQVRLWRTLMYKSLQDRGVPVRPSQVVMHSLVPDVGRVVFAHVDGRALPADIDPDWAALIVRVYTDPSLVWTRGWAHDVSKRQETIDVIKDAGGIVYREELERLIPRSRMFQYSRFYPGGKRAPGVAPSVQRVGAWDGDRGGEVGSALSLIACPHEDCGGFASVALWVPETARGLQPATSTICPDCRRLPVVGSPRFPEEYLRLPELTRAALPNDRSPE